MKDMIIGVDLAKRIFQVHGATRSGDVLYRKKLSREQFRAFLVRLPRCLVVFEACGPTTGHGRPNLLVTRPNSLPPSMSVLL